jgi:lysophospholipase L1-like esterase
MQDTGPRKSMIGRIERRWPTSGASSRRGFEIALSVIVAAVMAAGTFSGFLVGRKTADNYVRRVGLLIDDANVYRGMDVHEDANLNDPVTAQALAKIYGVPPGDRAVLSARLSQIPGAAPYRPAPFVGHLAPPVSWGELHVNAFGFRDDREDYSAKPDRTVRAFITGGSTAFGLGVAQKMTIAYQLEQMLNSDVSGNGTQYQVINTAFPAWASTQEKLMIQQYLVDMHPDVIIMFSGNNDVHWLLNNMNISHFYTYADQNYVRLLNELYAAAGHREWTIEMPTLSKAMECRDLGKLTARNVEESAFAARRAGARLIFALQPNIVSTSKILSVYEQRFRDKTSDKPLWDGCYESIREHLQAIAAPNFTFLDLSRSFGELGADTEVFLDYYHFADLGNRIIAQALEHSIDWPSIAKSVSAGTP